MTPEDRALLAESLKNDKNPTGTAPETAIRLLEETCQRTGLDWKLRHVYLVQRGGKWSVTVSIDGFRLIANQDPEYAGQDGPYWTMGPDLPWSDVPPDKAPYASKVGVVRNKGGSTSVTWGVAKFADYNARTPMWSKFPSTMIAKCAEMLALRKALPGRLGGLYGTEEMDQAQSKTERTSKPNEEVKDDPVNATDNWRRRIAEAKDLAALQEVGALIKDTHMGREIKLGLSVIYNDRKAELVKGVV